MEYHNILNKQITRLLPEKYSSDPAVEAFLASVSKSYNSFERANKIAEYAFEVSEREYQEINQSYKISKEIAEKASLAKSHFLSTMSHEIRTPMNAVIGFAHLLQQMDPNPDQAEYLKLLKFSAENLLVLINDILDFSKIEAGKIEFEDADFNIKDLIDNISLSLLQNANEKNIGVEIVFDHKLPLMVKGDSIRLGQILTNLINNAIKFTNEGKVTVRATLNRKSDDSTVIDFEVADTGIGIAPDKIASIFESFTQASADTSRKFGGTRLGLAITRKLLEMMNSEIKLESEPGKGSVFYFSLGMKNSNVRPVVNSDTNFNNELKSLRGLKILVADDNHINIVMIKQFMKKWEVECDTAENGSIALSMAMENHYQLILMDLEMPVMDGYQSTAAIRNLGGEYFKNLPIIALTASSVNEIKDKACMVGINDFVSKPFNPKDLYRKIEAYAPTSKFKYA